MKTSIFSFLFLFLVLCSDSWAQLTCTNCTLAPQGGTSSSTTATVISLSILTEPGTFTGSITLTGNSQFTITGSGNYTLSGQITGNNHSLTLNAPGTGSTANTGYTAGLTLTGAQANSYGSTTINSGYIICNKSSGVAIPGNIKLAGSTVPSHLWCLADNQLPENTVVDFTGTTNSYFNLNGTTQTIAGLVANTDGAVVENTGAADSRPAGMTAAQVSTRAATLNIKAGTGSYTYGGGARIRKGGAAAGALIMQVMSGTQIIKNPNGHINNVTLTTAEGATPEATLEFNTDGTRYSDYTLGTGITFRGGGIIKKTGGAPLLVDGATYLKTAGKMWINEGIWRSQGASLYAQGNESNKATLQVEYGALDISGNATIFGGLTGSTLSATVHNDWGQGDGYADFTINQNDTTTPAIFGGAIIDNQPDNPVSSGEFRGGIRLRKEGAGTQVLTNPYNSYTGSTTVSAGTLKLQGEGQLATVNDAINSATYTGTYGGTLEISNVSAPASQATFEHNGSQTQVFTGNITNTGAGETKGIFLQSGSGKTIINGADAKAFTGQVNITGGFLGGSGNLRNATAVTVGAGGSIGGGDRVAANGDTLTVSNLTFAAATSKLRVTSTADNKPSLVKVKTTGGDTPGTITAEHGFTVEIRGDKLVSGYIIKCSNGLNRSIPTLRNYTRKGVILSWDDKGLWMQVSVGEIIIRASVCPKGSTPGNPRITVDVTYTNQSDLPPAGAAFDFTLSDDRAKSGNMEKNQKDNIRTAVFDGANPTHEDLPYTIDYDDHKHGVISAEARINRQPTLSISSGGNPAYVGTPLVLQAVGNGGTISSENTDMATVGSTTETLSATATPKAAGHVNFLATDRDGCKSEYLSVEVKNPPPTGDPNSSVAFSVYPVPTQDRLTIVNDNGGDLQNITIRDISGKTVMNEAVNGRKATLSIAHFANGIYLLTVIDSKGVKRMKISKN